MKMIIITCLNYIIWRLKLLRFTGRALDTKTLQLSPLTENGPYIYAKCILYQKYSVIKTSKTENLVYIGFYGGIFSTEHCHVSLEKYTTKILMIP